VLSMPIPQRVACNFMYRAGHSPVAVLRPIRVTPESEKLRCPNCLQTKYLAKTTKTTLQKMRRVTPQAHPWLYWTHPPHSRGHSSAFTPPITSAVCRNSRSLPQIDLELSRRTAQFDALPAWRWRGLLLVCDAVCGAAPTERPFFSAARLRWAIALSLSNAIAGGRGPEPVAVQSSPRTSAHAEEFGRNLLLQPSPARHQVRVHVPSRLHAVGAAGP